MSRKAFSPIIPPSTPPVATVNPFLAASIARPVSPPTPAPSPQPVPPLNWADVQSTATAHNTILRCFSQLDPKSRHHLFTQLAPLLTRGDLTALSSVITPLLRRDIIADLPTELALHVFGFLDDPKDLARAARVSTTWRRLVSDEMNWKGLLEKMNPRNKAILTKRAYRQRKEKAANEDRLVTPRAPRLSGLGHSPEDLAFLSRSDSPAERRPSFRGLGLMDQMMPSMTSMSLHDRFPSTSGMARSNSGQFDTFLSSPIRQTAVESNESSAESSPASFRQPMASNSRIRQSESESFSTTNSMLLHEDQLMFDFESPSTAVFPTQTADQVNRSTNPFGLALTSIAPSVPQIHTVSPSPIVSSISPQEFMGKGKGRAVTMPLIPPSDLDSAFSYKTQFKRAYLTESNWLRGPGRLLSSQISHDDSVVTSLSLDSDWIVVGMDSATIHVFDARTGDYVRTLEGHEKGVWCITLISAGGHRIGADSPSVSGSPPAQASTSSARVRSASARQDAFFSTESITSPTAPSASLPTASFRPSASAGPSASFGRHQSPGQKQRRSVSFSEGKVKPNFGFRTGFGTAADKIQQNSVCGTAVGWGQSRAIIVSGGCDRDVRVWDVTSGRCKFVLKGHLATIRCMKVLDGQAIAITGSRDATLRVWDIEHGKLMHVLRGHEDSVRCMEVSGNMCVSGSYDNNCRLWNVHTGECVHVLEGHFHQIYSIAFDGVRIASGSLDSTVRVWSAKTGECLALLQGHTSLVGQLQLTDSVLVTGGSDGRVMIFSLSTFECLHRLCAHDNSVTALQFNERFMVTGGNDGRVKLWDRNSGRLIRELAEPCEAIWKVMFHEDTCVLLCRREGRTTMDVRTFAPLDEDL